LDCAHFAGDIASNTLNRGGRMAFCSACGAQIPAGATACPACSGSAGGPARAQAAGSGLTDNVAGLLAYLVIPAIVFLVQPPYNRNRFIRFHSFQAIFYWAAMVALEIAVSIVSSILWSILPFLAMIMVPIRLIVGLGGFILWIVLLLKAYQGEMFKIPFIGDIAEKQANT
jgi:uncharacterized membrane protein